jgi:hypothetical protein
MFEVCKINQGLELLISERAARFAPKACSRSEKLSGKAKKRPAARARVFTHVCLKYGKANIKNE